MFKEKLDYKTFMNGLEKRNPGEEEFHQAVGEVAESLIPFVNQHPKYLNARILERMTEPDRIISFRVCWEDDQKNIRTNRGYRVQFNNAIGPYKGGLRFHPSVSLSILKFLGFEQVFKNSLTTLPIGGAKGGSNFNPKGKSDGEMMRFCQSFMTELSRHIGPYRDVPAGDIGVGAREIGYMFGQFKRINNEFTGVLTGKGIEFGGSLIRKEATGYGCVYFAKEILSRNGLDFIDKKSVISGSGNVAQYTVEKLLHLGSKVIAMSDSKGFLYDKDGINQEKLDYIKEIKNIKRLPLSEYCKKFPKSEFHQGKRPWSVPCDLAFPCATQNELDEDDAKHLIKNKCILVAEGANMPTTNKAVHLLIDKKGSLAPGKAANAGGVAISGLEMTQNSMHLQWSKEEVDNHLQGIMKKIHDKCVKYGLEGDYVNYVKGANIGGFVKVADTILSCGII